MKRTLFAFAALQLALISSVGTTGSAMAAGAVVISPDGKTAYWSTHKESQTLAAEFALGNCSSRYGSCMLKIAFSHSCLAVAHSSFPAHWGYAVRNSAEEAQAAAMAACAGHGVACGLQVTSCE